MSQIFLHDASFHLFLSEIDQEFFEAEKKKGCHCGGSLHKADYPRRPMGVPISLRHYYERRCCLCCSRCRKRLLPPSVRFFGRRWFPAPWLVLISILTVGISERRCAQVRRHLGLKINESTWKRWRRWWRDDFVTTSFWLVNKGLFPPTEASAQGPFPRVLFAMFHGTGEEKITSLLRFFSPLTAGIYRAI